MFKYRLQRDAYWMKTLRTVYAYAKENKREKLDLYLFIYLNYLIKNCLTNKLINTIERNKQNWVLKPVPDLAFNIKWVQGNQLSSAPSLKPYR